MYVSRHAHGSRGQLAGVVSPLSTMWVLKLKLRLSGLVAGPYQLSHLTGSSILIFKMIYLFMYRSTL